MQQGGCLKALYLKAVALSGKLKGARSNGEEKKV
nr:MAG TPA: hypothetical protein [Caudoviricetes sp.]